MQLNCKLYEGGEMKRYIYITGMLSLWLILGISCIRKDKISNDNMGEEKSISMDYNSSTEGLEEQESGVMTKSHEASTGLPENKFMTEIDESVEIDRSEEVWDAKASAKTRESHTLSDKRDKENRKENIKESQNFVRENEEEISLGDKLILKEEKEISLPSDIHKPRIIRRNSSANHSEGGTNRSKTEENGQTQQNNKDMQQQDLNPDTTTAGGDTKKEESKPHKEPDETSMSTEQGAQEETPDFSTASKDFFILSELVKGDDAGIYIHSIEDLPKSAVIGLKATGENSGIETGLVWHIENRHDLESGKKGIYRAIVRPDRAIEIHNIDYQKQDFMVEIHIE